MVGVRRSDAVIAKLNELRSLTVSFCFLKDEPDTSIALLICQDLIAI